VDVAGGPAWRVRVAKSSFVSQPAWSARHRAFYVTTGRQLVRVGITATCRPRIVLARKELYGVGSPTVAGRLVCYGKYHGKSFLVARDALSGKQRKSFRVRGWPVAAPSVLNGSIFVGTLSGRLHGFVTR
jgi:PQQ-like domain